MLITLLDISFFANIEAFFSVFMNLMSFELFLDTNF